MKRLDHYWYSKNLVSGALLPLSWLFCLISQLRRLAYRRGFIGTDKLPVPVIVVGNISVGGTGKTPLVIWLAQHLLNQGYQPGIISRGYGGQATKWPQPVVADSDPSLVGDEPVMLAKRTGCTLWVGPDRPATARALLAASACDLLISDDGLQHYALQRDLEMVVIDGSRELGNGYCLPAGPLRERTSRLAEVDLVISNGPSSLTPLQMKLEPGQLINLADPTLRVGLDHFRQQTVHAMAGIGNPGRFFQTLRDAGLHLHEHPFPDHHRFSATDINPDDALPVIITEKDAVKCAPFSQQRHWYLEVSAVPGTGFIQQLDQRIREFEDG
ncbi:tetraacyldisaccharide 4'-kinase [Sedimenticola sp.]|uniref:tetraacyldisaccharide 4'-kinase n=1 Tax=Sedimenticola sp. TaxID=1940285 RepID=UPI003D0D05F1